MGLGVVLGLLVAVWLGWGPIRALLLGGQSSYTSTNSPTGMWVGQMDITGGADSANLGGNTPGPHKHGVLYARLDIEDRFMDKYAGHGELVILGEKQARPITLFLHLMPDSNSRLNADSYIGTKPPIVGTLLDCYYDQNKIVVISDGPLDLNFKVTLHRGNVDEYHKLLSQLENR